MNYEFRRSMPGPIRKRVGSVQRQRLLPNGAERHPGTHLGPRDSSVIHSNDLYLSPARNIVMHHPDGGPAAPLPVV
jgi:hypothetical protein